MLPVFNSSSRSSVNSATVNHKYNNGSWSEANRNYRYCSLSRFQNKTGTSVELRVTRVVGENLCVHRENTKPQISWSTLGSRSSESNRIDKTYMCTRRA
ncbi:hypothetical protein ATANTOWER_001711 [Ataeniobius toweri]|uniref:Uncharacterized protein n=1 Tax=Ataeniobius toweri TaxID=208326 RepID=A0ABU7AT11_9TELE|nr:hypothetical protein [Ataeniobius toweri]